MDQVWTQGSVHLPGDDGSEVQSGRKRRRVRLACQRCKGRKQKCDGGHPSCSTCLKVHADCRYVVSLVPKSNEQRQYTKALEERIVALESQLSSAGLQGIADDHWERSAPEEDICNPLSCVIRELSLNASGYFVGGTTHISLGRLLGPTIHGRPALGPGSSPDDAASSSHGSVTGTAAGTTGTIPRDSTVEVDTDAVMCANPDTGNSANDASDSSTTFAAASENISATSFTGQLVETKFEAYMTYVALERPFILSHKLHKMHDNRHTTTDVWEKAVLHLVYAIGGRSLELAGHHGDYAADVHYEVAMQHKDVILQPLDRRTIIFLVLASLYCLLSPKALGPWAMITLAMKTCIVLGLHRKSKNGMFGLASELDRRLFWTCYWLDRDTAISTGRPPSVSDHDIDTLLPMDINEESIDGETFYKAAAQDRNVPANPPTTLTHFVHIIRLKRLQSAIQHHIYRVDQEDDPSQVLINQYLTQLSDWKAQLPLSPVSSGAVDKGGASHPTTGASSSAFISNKDEYLMEYGESVRLLLFPCLFQDPIPEGIIKRCAEACELVCESCKRLHQAASPNACSPIAMQWVFLSGLTLIYCAWYAPQEVLTPSTISAIGSCSIMLYIMTERRPSAARYRDAFESMRQSVFDQLLLTMKAPRSMVDSVPLETRSVLSALDPGFVSSGLHSIIDSITGGVVSGEDFSLQDCDFTTDNLGAPVSLGFSYKQPHQHQETAHRPDRHHHAHTTTPGAGLVGTDTPHLQSDECQSVLYARTNSGEAGTISGSIAEPGSPDDHHGWDAMVLGGDKELLSLAWTANL